MEITLNQNDFLGSLTNLIINVMTNRTVADTVPAIVQSCLFDGVEYGDGIALLSVDTLTVEDYSDTSTLLTVKKPTIDEQVLTTTDKKKIQVTLNRYLMKGAFSNEYSINEAFATILSMLVKTKNIYMYKKVVKALSEYNGGKNNDGTPVELKSTQKITVDLVDIDQLDTQTEKEAGRRYNSNKIYKTLNNLFYGLTSPTRLYNELGYETLNTPDDFKFEVNGYFMTEMIVESLATLLNSAKISETETWAETHVIPDIQISEDKRKKFIGLFCDRNKYQIRPRFEVGTSFFDASTLNQNDWLHFWLISGFVNGYNAVLLEANFVAPAEINEIRMLRKTGIKV